MTGAGQNPGLGIAAASAAEGATVFLNDKIADAVSSALATLRRRGFKRLTGVPGDISVAPGYLHTDRWAAFAKAHVQRRRANVPLGREAAAEDIGV